MMSLDDDERCCSFEAYAAFDSDDGVSDVDVAADSERTCSIAYCLDYLYRIHFNSIE